MSTHTAQVSRIAFCARCMEDGVPPEKQHLLGRDICTTCGSKVPTPEALVLPGVVQRTARTLVKTFGFRLDAIEPRHAYSHGLVTARLHFRNRVQDGFTCIFSWYEREGFKKEHLQKGASWDEWMRSSKRNKLYMPELVNMVGRVLNKTFETAAGSPFCPRMTHRLETVDGEMFVMVELAWEQPGEPRYRVVICEPGQEHLSLPIKKLIEPLMTVYEPTQIADHCGRSLDGCVRIDIEDVTTRSVTHRFVYRDRRPMGV